MPQAGYQYGTSPRKIETEYERRKKKNVSKKRKLEVVKEIPKQQIKISKEQRRKHFKTTVTVLGLIMLMLTISCRNSQIDKQFNQIQNQKKQLANLQKENEQLNVSIENSLNLSNVEKVAKEELGMQKLSSKQIVYVTLPKKDYVESTTEKVIKEDKKQNWIQKIVNKFLNLK